MMKYLASCMAVLFMLLQSSAAFASAIQYTVNTSENVTVTGTPRLALTIGSTTRYATYSAGTGTNALTFSYTPVLGDFDADGIAVASPVDLNGGTIADAAGNNLALTYTPTATPLVKVQAYTPTFTTTPVTDANKLAVGISIAGAPLTSTYNYTFTSSGGGGSVTGSGTVSADPQAVTGINVSTLPSGTLTLSVTITAPSGTGTAKTATAPYTNSFTGVLDGLPATSSAFSVRRLATAYTGPLIRVRRSSDNTEQNIGYTSAGDLDTTALTTFCGANSCFLSKIYDQSGNGRDELQATQGNQPRIVNAGVIDTLNGHPTILYDGAGDYMQQAAGNMGTMVQPTIIATFLRAVSHSAQMFDIRANGDPNPLIDDSNADGFGARRRNDGGTLVSASNFTADSIAHVTSITYSNSSNLLSHWHDGTGPNTVSSTSSTSGTYSIALANNGLSPTGTSFAGQIPEFIIFSSVLTTPNRQAVEASEKAYYGTP